MPDAKVPSHRNDALADCPQDLRLAWEAARIADISASATAQIIESAEMVDLAAHESLTLLPPGGDDVGQPVLVVGGMIRMFVGYAGREVTYLYARESDMFGIPPMDSFNSVSSVSLGGQAVVDTRLLMLSPEVCDHLIRTDPSVGAAMFHVVLNALYGSVTLLAENVLFPLRRRVARHLLDLAVRQGDHLVVPVTVQELADATGSVRKVVTRLLGDMKREGLIDRVDGHLVLLDQRALHRVSQDAPGT